MRNRLKWVEEKCFMGETESGHAIVMDAGSDNGGRNRGARPMEMLLMGSSACMAYDIVDIFKKARKDLLDCWIDISYERAKEDPKVYTSINFHVVLTGRGISEADAQRAIDLSVEKYCCASIMLSKAVKMTQTYELIEAD